MNSEPTIWSNYFRILSPRAVAQLERGGEAFRAFVARNLVPGGPVRRFPNGAIEIDNSRVGEESHAAMAACIAPGQKIEGAGVFRSLAPFIPKRFYAIQYPLAYQERLRTEISFGVSPRMPNPPSPGESDLARLEVHIGFRTRTSKAVRQAFVAAIAAWGEAAATRGAFDDGPIALASAGIEFSGTWARFVLDASRSGQDTLNWLATVVLDFGENVHPTLDVVFGVTPEFLAMILEPIRAAPVLVEFPGSRPEVAREVPSNAEPADFVPLAARPDAEHHSDRFRVLALPLNEWDSFAATIYFARPLGDDERAELARLIDAYFLIGSYGGFGGGGIRRADPIAFDDATDSAIVRANMIGAESSLALPALIRILEGFEATGPPIDALVFGIDLDLGHQP